jgi:formamidopyrimidine-DNA glycosylase
MPELPEVECLRRSLEPHLIGRTVSRATLRRQDICEVFTDCRPRRATPADLLQGLTISELHRRGKQLAILSHEGPLLVVHLGMTGQLLFTPSPAYGGRGRRNGSSNDQTHVHATWTLSKGSDSGQLLFRDPRRFGGLWTFPSLDTLQTTRWSTLGPDALTISSSQLAAALEGSRRAIKAALLDQAVLAGVGNIYADESLFIAGINPRRLATALKPTQIDTLASATREVLSRSISTGGSTLRDYRDANGQAGSSQLTHAVYGRSGQACIRCSTRLRQAQVGQRTTVWCPNCQN